MLSPERNCRVLSIGCFKHRLTKQRFGKRWSRGRKANVDATSRGRNATVDAASKRKERKQTVSDMILNRFSSVTSWTSARWADISNTKKNEQGDSL